MQLIPQIIELNPKLLGGLGFARFTLGKYYPSFGPISVNRVTDSLGKESLEIELDAKYLSDMDILLESGYGLNVGIRRPTFMG